MSSRSGGRSLPRALLAGADPTARRLIAARALRGFGDGLTSVVLPAYLLALGLGETEVGAVATATLLGSALLTLGVGLYADRIGARPVLLGASALLAATGLGFASVEAFAALLVLAFVGTLNPSAGDVSVFLPTEQAVIAGQTAGPGRTSVFARYNIAGSLGSALGALAAAVPERIALAGGFDFAVAARGTFVAYAALGLATAALYWRLPRRAPPRADAAPRRPRVLQSSRGIVARLTALFSLDSFGGGFVVQSILVLWLLRRFDLSLEAAGLVMGAASVLSALSQLASAPLAERIGLIRTMVYTHVPANVFLMAAALAPGAPLAIACLLARASLSQMDVPARQAYVMAMVPEGERAAAASVTNVPRSLATAIGPLLAGALLAKTSFGWPLLVAGGLKLTYDALLLAAFRHRPAPGERSA